MVMRYEDAVVALYQAPQRAFVAERARLSKEGGVNSRVMFDTGALIALERRHQRICKIHRMAVESGLDALSERVGRWNSERGS